MELFTKLIFTIKTLANANRRGFKLWGSLFFLLSTYSLSFSQLAVTQNSNDTTLSQLLAGSGVTISNVTKNCNTSASGTFNNVSSTLGLTQGIVLATGKVSSISQPASSFASTALTGTGDPQLSTLTAGTIYDPCILEFDVVPQGDTLQFKYVFASEEYPEFVCSQFNDVFGFFISGPNPVGGSFTNTNIAIIPNSTLPVCINAVNDGISGTYNGTTWNSNGCISLSYTADYVNNISPVVSPYIVYNGMTKVLSAVSPVVPCQTYHLKIAIADVGDRFYDSGVFLQAYSVSSKPYTVTLTSAINDTTYAALYQGCMGGTFTVSLSSAQTSPVTVALNISGTAANGVDYSTIPDSVTIPAGQTSITIPVSPLQNNFPAVGKTVTVAILNQCSGAPVSSASLLMMNNPARSLTTGDTTLCAGQSTQLTASGGKSYTWTPTTGLSNSNISNPVATPTTTTDYTANITWGTCVYQLSQIIYVSKPAIALTVSPADTVCTGTSIQLSASANGGVAPYAFLWSNGNTTTGISTVLSGTYNVTTTDKYGCSASVSQNLIELNPLLVASVTNVNCFNANTGVVNLTLSGGVAPYTYSWSNGSVNSALTNVAAGNYKVTATDVKGCTATATAAITQPTSALIPVAATTGNVSCFGGNNGTISLSVSGGTPGYIYNWAGGVTTQNRANLIGGNYAVTVTDSKGCSATTVAMVTEPAAILSAVPTAANVNCFGANTGSISLTVTGGTIPYTFNWGGGIATQNRNNLAAGNYNVTVTDANGCPLTSSSAITQPAAALSANLNPSNVVCFGGHNGSINLTVTGGTTPYYYLWNDGATIPDVANLVPGNYSVTVTDVNGCSVTVSSVISQPVGALTVSASINNASCFGSNNGSINLTTTGGTPAYTYNWIGGITTQNRINLASGSYDVTVTDNKGCSVTTVAAITQPVSALAATPATTHVNCFGENTGSINLSVSGGTLPYIYNWTGGITTQNRNNLAAGNYSVTITDANGCSVTLSSAITQPVAALTAAATVNTVACFGGNSGAISLSVSGGTPQYLYLWSNGATVQNLANLTAGNYAVTITDVNGCSTVNNAIISQPAAALSITAATNNAGCFGSNTGSVNLTVTGGTPIYIYSWTGGITTQNRTNLAAGSYDVTVTDSKGCSVTTAAAITQPVSALTAIPATTYVNCFGGNTGTINLSVSGGTTSYAFNWGGGITTQNRNNLAAGNYNVTVTDVNGCSSMTSATVSQPAASLTVSANSTAVKCYGATGGSIILNAAGGTAPYLYNWGGGVVTSSRSNLATGNYTATITDANGCSAVVTDSIAQPSSSVQVSILQNNVDCYGNGDGVISVTASGGTSPYTYSWNDGSNAVSRTDLTPGNYLITVTDANACSATTSGQITQPIQALKALAVVTNPTCNAANNGAISLNVSGGTPPYFFKWDSNSTSQNRTQLAAGNYQVTVTDANGCNMVERNTVTQPAPLAIVLATTPVSCFGGNTGSIASSVNGGTPAYSFNWGNGISTQNRGQLIAGNYTLTVTDANSCTTSVSANISQPAGGISVSPTVGNVSCLGGSNGTIHLITTGGSAPYTFAWNGGETTQNLSGLSAGVYLVSVSDNNGCNAIASATVIQPVSAVNISALPTNVSCFNGNNGTVNLTVSGGTSPYTFGWNSGQRLQDIAGLIAGNYSVVVSDANGCSAGASAIVSQPAAAVNASVSAHNISCYGGSNGVLNLAATGGTAPYSFAWSNNASTQNIQNLASGIYHVTITDALGCSTTATSAVTQPASAVTAIIAATGTSCFGGSNGVLTLQASGGTSPYNYNWGGGVTSQNRATLSAGNYTVTIMDANSCSSSASAIVAQPVSGISVVPAISNVSCNGGDNGSISLHVTGGTAPYNYNWAGGATTQNRAGLAAGNYVVTVTDAKGCLTIARDTVSQPQHILNVTTGVTSEVSCYNGDNGNVQLSITGGTSPYSYNWNGGITTENRSNLSAGNYVVTVTDSHGCTATSSALITQPDSALTITGQVTNIACFGGTTGAVNIIVLGGTNPYSYNWGSGVITQNRTGLAAGNYIVTVTDVKGCQATVSATVTQAGSTINVSDVVTSPRCFGADNGAIKLNVNGGTSPYTYNWNGGAGTQSRNNLAAGSYTVTVTDAHGCTATAQAVITSPDSISLMINETGPTCFGSSNGKLQVNASGGTPGYKFLWNSGATNSQILNVSAGDYSITVTDANGCSAEMAGIIVNQPVQIDVSIQVLSGSCAGNDNGKISATVSGGTSPYQYLWSNGAANLQVNQLGPGTYVITVTDANQCTQIGSAAIADLPGVSGNGTANPLPCQNAVEELQLFITSGTGPYSYKWSNGDTTGDINNAHPGSYSVTVQDANGCKFDTTLVIENLNNFSVQASGGGTINLGGNSELHVTGTGLAQTVYNWAPGSSLSCTSCLNTIAQPTETTTYTVVGTDTNGCIASDTVSVIVIEDYTIFTPNAFTPNGDGNNDYFQIFGNLAGIHSIDIKIFDRWGEKVFESEEPTFKWDGTYKGVLQSPQVFAYEMKIVFQDGHSDLLKKGSITLIR